MNVRPCPEGSRNCYRATFAYEGGAQGARARLKAAIADLEDVRWVREDESFWHVECRTKIFRFVDDLEIAFDDAASAIHVRSASRVGKSDLGANRKRVETLRELFERA